jgi:hypothetical protein
MAKGEPQWSPFTHTHPPVAFCLKTVVSAGCVCVKGLQCGSPFAIRTRDPPIIQVEIPTVKNCETHQEPSQNASCREVASQESSQKASCPEVASQESSQDASCLDVLVKSPARMPPVVRWLVKSQARMPPVAEWLVKSPARMPPVVRWLVKSPARMLLS